MYPWLPWCVYYTEESGKPVFMFWSFYCISFLCILVATVQKEGRYTSGEPQGDRYYSWSSGHCGHQQSHIQCTKAGHHCWSLGPNPCQKTWHPTTLQGKQIDITLLTRVVFPILHTNFQVTYRVHVMNNTYVQGYTDDSISMPENCHIATIAAVFLASFHTVALLILR